MFTTPLIDKSIIKESESLVLPISNIYKPVPQVEKAERKKVWDFEVDGGFSPPRPVGEKMLLEVYYPQESAGGVEFAKMTQNILKFSSVVGLVVKLGSGCYKGDRFKYWAEDEIPKVGYWVTFKPGSGDIYAYRGIPITIIYDDCITSIIEKPEYVER